MLNFKNKYIELKYFITKFKKSNQVENKIGLNTHSFTRQLCINSSKQLKLRGLEIKLDLLKFGLKF